MDARAHPSPLSATKLDRLERAGVFQHVYDAYAKLAAADSARVRVIDAARASTVAADACAGGPPAVLPMRIVVGMSGGVDSTICALLLQRFRARRHRRVLKNWEETDADGVCTATRDWQDVQAMRAIGIPYYPVSFTKLPRPGVQPFSVGI